MRVSRIALMALLAAAAAQPAAAQQDYASTATPTGAKSNVAFSGGGYVVGQTFAATDNILDAFGFYASSSWSGDATFQAYLFGTSGSSLSGSALYTSSVLSYSSITTGWFDFFTGGVSLSAGNVYMAILAPVSVTSGVGTMNLGTVGNAYAGDGLSTWSNMPTSEATLQSVSWWSTLGSQTGVSGNDYALRTGYGSQTTQQLTLLSQDPGEEDPFGDLSTTSAPEPATIVLMGTGLIGLVGASRMRRKRLG